MLCYWMLQLVHNCNDKNVGQQHVRIFYLPTKRRAKWTEKSKNISNEGRRAVRGRNHTSNVLKQSKIQTNRNSREDLQSDQREDQSAGSVPDKRNPRNGENLPTRADFEGAKHVDFARVDQTSKGNFGLLAEALRVQTRSQHSQAQTV